MELVEIRGCAAECCSLFAASRLISRKYLRGISNTWILLSVGIYVCFEERFVLHMIVRGSNIAGITADTCMFSYLFYFSDKVQSDDEKSFRRILRQGLLFSMVN